MKLYHKYAYGVLALLLIFLSCSKKATDYRSFLEGTELTYPGIVSNPGVLVGKNRLQLIWHPNPDPSVSKYVVYWNNFADSLVVSATTHNTSDTVRCSINNLAEYVYSFFIYSYDNKGNRSVATEVDNARVYGTVYTNTLHNRLENSANPYTLDESNNSLTLRFATPDTINITTVIRYTNGSNQVVQKALAPDADSIILPNYLFGTPIVYQSSYIPAKGSLDTFMTPQVDTFPTIHRVVLCSKSLFSALHLAGDVNPYESGTNLDKLWDGSVGPQGYPNIWHSNGDNPLPHVMTFDMGKVYYLNNVEEVGRNCCHNPTDFEIWGTADITNAETSLPANNSGWPAEARAKGWTMLKEVVRSSDNSAQDPLKIDMPENLPAVRYIRIRVKTVASGDNNYSNMSELTFWEKQ